MIDSKLQAYVNTFGNDCYRAILGVNWIDNIPNEQVLDLVKKRPLANTQSKRQLGCLGHVMRLEDVEPDKIFALFRSEHGNQKRGRPACYYNKQIERMLGMSVETVTPAKVAELTAKKKEWSKMTATQER